MAVYINSRRWVKNANRTEDREVIDYFVDTPADITLLPDATEIRETSTALVVSNATLYTLMTTGWVIV